LAGYGGAGAGIQLEREREREREGGKEREKRDRDREKDRERMRKRYRCLRAYEAARGFRPAHRVGLGRTRKLAAYYEMFQTTLNLTQLDSM
jgi:hypothetical protein